jgi:hypothetical protein
MGEPAHRLGGGLASQGLTDHQVSQTGFTNGSPTKLRPSVTPSV